MLARCARAAARSGARSFFNPSKAPAPSSGRAAPASAVTELTDLKPGQLKAPALAPPAAAWQDLSAKLKSNGIDSKYAARLEARVVSAGCFSVEELEAEMMQEVASALSRTEDKLLIRLVRVESAQLDVAEAAKGGSSAARAAAVAAFAAARGAAVDARREMTIHRQACGFRSGNYHTVEQTYPIPTLAEALGQQPGGGGADGGGDGGGGGGGAGEKKKIWWDDPNSKANRFWRK